VALGFRLWNCERQLEHCMGVVKCDAMQAYWPCTAVVQKKRLVSAVELVGNKVT
jgi:hypothetical protein